MEVCHGSQHRFSYQTESLLHAMAAIRKSKAKKATLLIHNQPGRLKL
jgi:hypothetical protein